MRFFAILTAVAFALSMSWHALAQEAAPAEDTQPPAASDEASFDEGSSDEASSDEGTQKPLLDKAQLDQLVAPIALYPDSLLSQVLIASTYPLEVVQADRWVLKNEELKGDALHKALVDQDWDDSIKVLAAVPDVLALMNDDLDWTSKLGDAVLAQQGDVMEAVQRLRERAKANGMLKSNEQQTVKVEDQPAEEPAATETAEPQTTTVVQASAQQVIVIEQAAPETVYVPYYNPAVVYGTWPYASYPPYYFRPAPGYVAGGALARGIAWGAGFAIGNAIWGNGFDWRRNNIRVNYNRNVYINNRNVTINNRNVRGTNWNHNSYHRRGVNYSNKNVRKKHGKGNAAHKRPDFRGHDGRPGHNGKPDFGGNKGMVGTRDLGGKGKPNRAKGNAFDHRDGAKAKDFSKRGKDSLGKRNATKAARPSPAKKKPAAQRPKPKKKPAVKKPQHRPAAKKPQHRPAAKKPQHRPAAKKPQHRPAAKRPSSRPSAHRPSGARKGGGGGGNRGRGGGGRGGGGGRRR